VFPILKKSTMIEVDFKIEQKSALDDDLEE
jgi:hypothetical protein